MEGVHCSEVLSTVGGSLVRKEVAHNLMRLIAEGTDDEEMDSELRLDAVSSYLDLLDKPHLPDILVKIICWVSTNQDTLTGPKGGWIRGSPRTTLSPRWWGSMAT